MMAMHACMHACAQDPRNFEYVFLDSTSYYMKGIELQYYIYLKFLNTGRDWPDTCKSAALLPKFTACALRRNITYY